MGWPTNFLSVNNFQVAVDVFSHPLQDSASLEVMQQGSTQPGIDGKDTTCMLLPLLEDQSPPFTRSVSSPRPSPGSIPQSLQGSEVMDQGSTQPGIDGKDTTCTPLPLLEEQSPPFTRSVSGPRPSPGSTPQSLQGSEVIEHGSTQPGIDGKDTTCTPLPSLEDQSPPFTRSVSSPRPPPGSTSQSLQGSEVIEHGSTQPGIDGKDTTCTPLSSLEDQSPPFTRSVSSLRPSPGSIPQSLQVSEVMDQGSTQPGIDGKDTTCTPLSSLEDQSPPFTRSVSSPRPSPGSIPQSLQGSEVMDQGSTQPGIDGKDTTCTPLPLLEEQSPPFTRSVSGPRPSPGSTPQSLQGSEVIEHGSTQPGIDGKDTTCTPLPSLEDQSPPFTRSVSSPRPPPGSTSQSLQGSEVIEHGSTQPGIDGKDTTCTPLSSLEDQSPPFTRSVSSLRPSPGSIPQSLQVSEVMDQGSTQPGIDGKDTTCTPLSSLEDQSPPFTRSVSSPRPSPGSIPQSLQGSEVMDQGSTQPGIDGKDTTCTPLPLLEEQSPPFTRSVSGPRPSPGSTPQSLQGSEVIEHGSTQPGIDGKDTTCTPLSSLEDQSLPFTRSVSSPRPSPGSIPQSLQGSEVMDQGSTQPGIDGKDTTCTPLPLLEEQSPPFTRSVSGPRPSPGSTPQSLQGSEVMDQGSTQPGIDGKDTTCTPLPLLEDQSPPFTRSVSSPRPPPGSTPQSLQGSEVIEHGSTQPGIDGKDTTCTPLSSLEDQSPPFTRSVSSPRPSPGSIPQSLQGSEVMDQGSTQPGIDGKDTTCTLLSSLEEQSPPFTRSVSSPRPSPGSIPQSLQGSEVMDQGSTQPGIDGKDTTCTPLPLLEELSPPFTRSVSGPRPSPGSTPQSLQGSEVIEHGSAPPGIDGKDTTCTPLSSLEDQSPPFTRSVSSPRPSPGSIPQSLQGSEVMDQGSTQPGIDGKDTTCTPLPLLEEQSPPFTRSVSGPRPSPGSTPQSLQGSEVIEHGSTQPGIDGKDTTCTPLSSLEDQSPPFTRSVSSPRPSPGSIPQSLQGSEVMDQGSTQPGIDGKDTTCTLLPLLEEQSPPFTRSVSSPRPSPGSTPQSLQGSEVMDQGSTQPGIDGKDTTCTPLPLLEDQSPPFTRSVSGPRPSPGSTPQSLQGSEVIEHGSTQPGIDGKDTTCTPFPLLEDQSPPFTRSVSSPRPSPGSIPQSLQGSEVMDQGSTQPGIDGKDTTCTPLSSLEDQSPPFTRSVSSPRPSPGSIPQSLQGSEVMDQGSTQPGIDGKDTTCTPLPLLEDQSPPFTRSVSGPRPSPRSTPQSLQGSEVIEHGSTQPGIDGKDTICTPLSLLEDQSPPFTHSVSSPRPSPGSTLQNEEVISEYLHNCKRMLHTPYERRVCDGVSVSTLSGLSMSNYVVARSTMCYRSHEQPCKICLSLLEVATTVLHNGFCTLRYAFSLTSPNVVYDTQIAKRKLLQMPLAAIRVGKPRSGTSFTLEPQTPHALTSEAGLCSTRVRGPQTQPAPTPVGGPSSTCIGEPQTPHALTSVAGLCSTRVRGPQTQPAPTPVGGPSSSCIGEPQTQPAPTPVGGPSSSCIGEPQTPHALTSVAGLCSTRVRGPQTQPAPTHVDTSNPIGVSLVTCKAQLMYGPPSESCNNSSVSCNNSSVSTYYCGTCGAQYEEETEESEIWIGCDFCDMWFHLACEGLGQLPTTPKYMCSKCYSC